MDNFVVSARKYRPITFDSVVGQGSITSTLKNAIKNNHLAQAFLFTGPRGVGKTTCARIFAKTINCYNLNDKMEPCDECESCVSFNQSNSFNIHELDAASNNSVEDIRRLVEQVRIPPQVGQYKVYIIDEVHMLSQAAFNAFLKTLEEPPAYAKFILATTEKHKIIPTILSRCQIYDFNRITVKDIADYLAFVAKSEGVTAEEEALLVMAQKADGAMRDALSIFDQIVSFTGKNITYKATIENLNVLDTEYYFQMTSLFLRGDISGSLIIFNDIISKGFDGLHFINGLASHFRNLLISKDKKTINLLETSDSIKIQYINQAAKCSLRFLVFALDLCTAVDLAYKSSSDKRLLIELNLMKICKLNNPFEEMNAEQIEAAKEKKKIEPPKAEETKISYNKTVTPKAKPEVQIPKEEIKPKVEAISDTKKEPTPRVEEPKEKDNSTDTKPQSGFKRSTRSRGISIKQTKIDKIPEEEKVNIADALDTKFESVSKELSKDELKAAIEKYIKTISKDKPAFASAIEFKNIDLLANNEIHLHLANQAMDDKELKYDLLLFLKKELNNTEIQISTEINKVEIKPQETSMDVYKRMAQKNPQLDILRSQLDLDFNS
jgi:DNA polymerase-3 subunit gamma/tau